MLRLRLARTGRRNQPKYRIVVAEKSEKLNGKVVATVGHYIPTGAEKTLIIDKEAIEKWLSQGTIASNTVAKLLNTQGFKLPVEMSPIRPAKKAAKAEAAAPAAAPAAEAAPEEKPAEEVETAVEEVPAEEAIAEGASGEERGESETEVATAEEGTTQAVPEASPDAKSMEDKTADVPDTVTPESGETASEEPAETPESPAA